MTKTVIKSKSGQREMAFKIKKKKLNELPAWISGRYKIVLYDDGYYAYFKPHNWKGMCGNSCEYTSRREPKVYETLELAESACRKHLETFGSKPQSTDRIYS